MKTQIDEAVRGVITQQVGEVARNERMPAHALREAVAGGKAVIPINRLRHGFCLPTGIGSGLRTKVNANIGTSPRRVDVSVELHKLEVAVAAGADAIMDLSTGGDIDSIRKRILDACSVPMGTVPVYQAAAESESIADMGIEGFLDVLQKHAGDGVDFVTIHAGITREALPLLEKRLLGVVSRGGSMIIKWMRSSGKENFLYEHFDEITSLASEYDLTLSLGDGLRPGCIADATDEAQLNELKVLGQLAARARESGVQVMIEGPGHVPMADIRRNVELEKSCCDGAPFYVLGPLPTDIAAGYDHIAGAIGGAIAAGAGADFLCYLTPREHLGLPDAEDVRDGVIIARIAAHVGDLEKKVPGADRMDREMSKARAARDWEAMTRLAIDPERFAQMLGSEDRTDTCSMCGELCAIKIYAGSAAEPAE